MSTKNPSFPISRKDIDALRGEATGLLRVVSYKPSPAAAKKDKKKSGVGEEALMLFEKAVSGTSSNAAEILKSMVTLRPKFLPDTITMTEKSNAVILALQEGLAIAYWVRDAYTKASGLDTLKNQAQAGSIPAATKQELDAKQQTAAAITAFVYAYYVQYTLAKYRTDTAVMATKFAGIPEVNFMSPLTATQSILYYYAQYLGFEGFVGTEDDLVNFTLLYFEEVGKEVIIRKDSLKYAESFNDRTYQLEGSDFAINGWKSEIGSQAVSIEFNKIKFEEIVGNREAKHRAMRIIGMMLAFDFVMKDNPFNRFGGFPTLSMGYGKPGTGKSMLIAATATRLKELCDWLGYKFLFWPFPDNIVSTYQGGSAERALDWFRPILDTSKIIYAPIDDAENALQNRSQQGVSAGVREIIGVFLRMTEGAYAVNHGNYSIGVYTNLPDMIDPAVLSRIQYRAPIDGAITEHDFMDQMRIWLKTYEKLDANFLSLQQPVGYEFFAHQKQLKNLSEMMKGVSNPKQLITQDAVLQVYESLEKTVDVNSYEFFGKFYSALQQKYAGFTSREVRNIEKIVGARIMDFDLDQQCWDKPDVFFHQPLDQKIGIITELVRANMKNMKLGEVMLEEALKYADNYVRISDTEEDRMVQQRLKDMRIFDRADELMQKYKLERAAA